MLSIAKGIISSTKNKIRKIHLVFYFEAFHFNLILITCFDNILITVQKLIIKTGTLRLPFLFNPQCGLHVRDNRVAKL